jgi:hypothetical protein
VRAGLAGRARPWRVSGLTNVILQFIEGLNGDADNILLLSLSIHAEIRHNVTARQANAIVSRLARVPSLVCGVPKHAICQGNVKPSREDRR